MEYEFIVKGEVGFCIFYVVLVCSVVVVCGVEMFEILSLFCELILYVLL